MKRKLFSMKNSFIQLQNIQVFFFYLFKTEIFKTKTFFHEKLFHLVAEHHLNVVIIIIIFLKIRNEDFFLKTLSKQKLS